MPAGDEEIFATAVDRGTHPAFAGDAELARDLELVALLQRDGAGLAPRPDERARSRAAVFARLAAAQDPSDHAEVPGTAPVRPDAAPLRPTALFEAVEDAADSPVDGPVDGPVHDTAVEPEPTPDPADELARLRKTRGPRRHAMPTGRANGDATRRPPIGGRIVMVAAAAVLGTAVLGGAGVLASRNSLPGDGLYPVKRVAESAGLAMTFDEAERGRRHLDLASTRIGEVEQLLAQDGAEMDPEVFRSGLQEFDADADEGYRLLLAAEESRAAAEAEWQAWAADQSARLAALRGDLPGPAATNAAGSLERLEQLGGTPATSDDDCTDGSCTGAVPGAGTGATSPALTGTTDPSRPERSGAPSTDRSGSGGRSGTGGQEGGQQSGDQGSLLPGLLPEDPLGGVLGGSGGQGSGGSGSTGGSDGDSDDDQDSGDSGRSGGGLPPVEVPPLVPGLPGVSIG